MKKKELQENELNSVSGGCGTSSNNGPLYSVGSVTGLLIKGVWKKVKITAVNGKKDVVQDGGKVTSTYTYDCILAETNEIKTDVAEFDFHDKPHGKFN